MLAQADRGTVDKLTGSALGDLDGTNVAAKGDRDELDDAKLDATMNWDGLDGTAQGNSEGLGLTVVLLAANPTGSFNDGTVGGDGNRGETDSGRDTASGTAQEAEVTLLLILPNSEVIGMEFVIDGLCN